MHIIHVGSECAPLVKVGGLGDAVSGMATALAKIGAKVEVILPKYASIPTKELSPFTQKKELSCLYNNTFSPFSLWQAHINGILFTLIEPKNYDFFSRPQVYGYPDDSLRFSYFCLAVQSYLNTISSYPTLHLHDWHTALLAYFNHLLPQAKPTLFTIHNLAYQGMCDLETLQAAGLDKNQASLLYLDPCYNLMKGGIEFSDAITTVSKTYAEEILYTKQGLQLQPLLWRHRKKISGILNGIDTEYWDPAKDPTLAFHYSSENRENKQKMKRFIRKKMGLEESQAPLVCSITRLAEQKGPLLIYEAIKRSVALGGQYILLGSGGSLELNHLFSTLPIPPKHYFKQLVYDEELSHQVYAASDLLVMPSLFEPCGLAQLIAMRYGTLPLVHATGGLKETILHQKNGFIFEEPTVQALNATLKQSLDLYTEQPKEWQKIQLKGMQEDHSWSQSIAHYMALYEKINSSHHITKDGPHIHG